MVSKLTATQQEIFDIAKNEPHLILTNTDGLWLEWAREFLRINPDEEGEDESIDPTGIPFVPKRAQLRLLEMYWLAKREERQFRVVVNKPRQIGASSLIAMVGLTEACLRTNIEVLIGAQLKDGPAMNIWEKYLFALRNMPNNKDKHDRKIFAVGGSPQSGRMKLKNSESVIRLVGEKIDVGSTLQFGHLSEAAHYHDFDNVMKHLLPALRRGNRKSVFIESTAKNYGDSYHEYFKRAQEGKSKWEAFFSPWFEDEDYFTEIPADEYDEFVESIGELQNLYGDERQLMVQYDLKPEQIAWRRDTIDDDSKGILADFQMNYPCTPEEAFLAQDMPYFHTASLEWYIENQCKDIQFMTGTFIPDSTGSRPEGREKFEFVEDRAGATKLLEHPDPFADYCWGFDGSESTPDGDFNVAVIMRRHPFKVVGLIRGEDATKLSPGEFARQLGYCIQYFNKAKGIPEANAYAGVVIDTLERWSLRDCMLRESMVFKEAPNKNSYGVRTTAQSKRACGEFLREAMRIDFSDDERGIMNAEYAPIVNFAEIINEMKHCVPHNGSFQAKNKGEYRPVGKSPQGYLDDCVIAMMYALQAHRALPTAQSREYKMVEKHGHDHELTQGLEHIQVVDPIADMRKPVSRPRSTRRMY